jgi:hypothetical protein
MAPGPISHAIRVDLGLHSLGGLSNILTQLMAKKSKKPRQSTRAKGVTMISISIPESLLGKIDQMADAEKRSRSNFIANVFHLLVAKSGK